MEELSNKKNLINKINETIQRKRNSLLSKLPIIHTIEDGIIVRFFSEWDSCIENNNILYKKITNIDKPDELILFFYIPKGTFFTVDKEKNKYISYATCLSGKIEIEFNNTLKILSGYTKNFINSDKFQGRALENTYIITSNKL